jgi:hypothetical protein
MLIPTRALTSIGRQAEGNLIVISTERSDDECMDAGGRATLEAKAEKSR